MKRWKKTKKMLVFRVEKVLKREVDKVLVKLVVHGSSFHNNTGLLKILEVVLFNTIPINVSQHFHGIICSSNLLKLELDLASYST